MRLWPTGGLWRHGDFLKLRSAETVSRRGSEVGQLALLLAAILVIAFGMAGFAGVVYNITGVSLQQTVAPDRLLGRLNASRRFIVWGAIPLGSLTGLALASRIGLHAMLSVSAIGTALSFLPVLLSPLRSLRAMPEEPDAMPTIAPGVPALVRADA